MYSRLIAAPRRWHDLLVRVYSSQTVLRLVYGAWLLAFAFKLIGSSWDVSWHFRFLRDDLAPPHMINTVGAMLGVALITFQSLTGLAIERWGMRLVQAGTAIFLAAIPLDLINHRLFGLDITAWSPTHALLYLGTGVMLAGVLRSWLALAGADRWRPVFALALWTLFLENVLFPLGQQEYGVRALDAYLDGRSTASGDLLALAGENAVRFVLGPIPLWVYPVYLIVTSTLVLGIARLVQGWRWTATTIAAIYLVYRVIASGILLAGGFPGSFIPFMLLGAALIIDLTASRKWPALLPTVLLLVVFYGGAYALSLVTLVPPFPLATAPVVGALLWPCFVAFSMWRRRRISSGQPSVLDMTSLVK